jgi:hypothetical protein
VPLGRGQDRGIIKQTRLGVFLLLLLLRLLLALLCRLLQELLLVCLLLLLPLLQLLPKGSHSHGDALLDALSCRCAVHG